MSVIFRDIDKPERCDLCFAEHKYRNLGTIYCEAIEKPLVSEWDGLDTDIEIEVPEWCPALDFDMLEVYGYDFKDILVFAELCRRNQISDYQMKDFIKSQTFRNEAFARKVFEEYGVRIEPIEVFDRSDFRVVRRTDGSET